MWYSAIGFIVTLTLSLLAAPLTTEAQTLAKMPRIGIMGDWPEDSPKWGVFRQGLRELGYMEGHNIAIEWRFTGGSSTASPIRRRSWSVSRWTSSSQLVRRRPVQPGKRPRQSPLLW